MNKPQGKAKDLDRSIEMALGNLLRVGVIAAGAVVIIGAIFFLARHGTEIPSYHIFKADPFNFSDFRDLLNGVIALRSVSIMELGVLLLIATPIIRVLFSVFAFIYEKDYMYVAFTLFVLLVLIYSFLPR